MDFVGFSLLAIIYKPLNRFQEGVDGGGLADKAWMIGRRIRRALRAGRQLLLPMEFRLTGPPRMLPTPPKYFQGNLPQVTVIHRNSP